MVVASDRRSTETDAALVSKVDSLHQEAITTKTMVKDDESKTASLEKKGSNTEGAAALVDMDRAMTVQSSGLGSVREGENNSNDNNGDEPDGKEILPRPNATENNEAGKMLPATSHNKMNMASTAHHSIDDDVAHIQPLSLMEDEKVRAAEARRELQSKHRGAGHAATPGAESVGGKSDHTDQLSSKIQQESTSNMKSTTKTDSHPSIPLSKNDDKGVGAQNVVSVMSVAVGKSIDTDSSDVKLSKSTESPKTLSKELEKKEMDTPLENKNRDDEKVNTQTNHERSTLPTQSSTVTSSGGGGGGDATTTTVVVAAATITNGGGGDREVARSTPGVQRTTRDEDDSDNDNDEEVGEMHGGSDPIISATLVPDNSWNIETVTAVKDRVGRRRVIYGCAVVVVIALVIGIVVSVILGRRNDGTLPPSSVPSTAPSMSPTFTLDGLVILLSAISTDNGAALETPGTAQNRALMWLTNQPFAGEYSDSRLVQRYAIATLYFSMGGDRWIKSDNWLTGENECDWFLSDGPACDEDGRIVQIDLSLNSLSRAFPPEIGLLTKVTSLDLSSNSVFGTIPSEIGLLTGLDTLVISANRFTGTIPTQLWNLSNLTALALDNNNLSGEFPTEIGLLTDLVVLRLQGNVIVGSLPASIGNCASLQRVDLSSNRLYGNLPTEVGDLSMLEEFISRDTLFEGMLPSEFGNLHELSKWKEERDGDDVLRYLFPWLDPSLANKPTHLLDHALPSVFPSRRCVCW